MNPTDAVSALFRYRPWRPLPLSLLARDLKGPASASIGTDDSHLGAAIDWLCHAQDVRRGGPGDGGVSAGWNFEDGWLPSYPETTGYIVETFVAAASALGRPDLLGRARQMLEWELSLQLADGAFPGHFGEPGSAPVIFNTGQIIHGLMCGHEQLGMSECLPAALRAAAWMAAQQDEDGCWRRSEHNGIPHVYNTRATWGMLRAAIAGSDSGLIAAAERNLRWALTQQRPCGWFATNGFLRDRDPFTHTIAYAIRGLLECGHLLSRDEFVVAAMRASDGMARAQRDDGWIAGTYAEGWRPTASYACVTGVAQMALCWQRLGHIAGEERFKPNVARAIDYVKRTQDRDHPDPIVRGGIPGSSPMWGDYSRFEFPNWAAKFFADALLMRMTGRPVPAVRIQAGSVEAEVMTP